MTAPDNPLRGLHEQAEAEFQPWAGVEIVETFGEPQAEYAAIRNRCALLDLPQRTLIEMTGPDRLPFLNNLLTNQTWDKAAKTGLRAGEGVYAMLLNARSGRIACDLAVLERGDRTLIEIETRLAPLFMKEIERYLFAEKVTLRSLSATTHTIALHGPAALRHLRGAADGETPELDAFGSAELRVIGQAVTVWRDDAAGVPGYHLALPKEHAGAIWMHLLTFGSTDEPGRRPVRAVGWAAFNATRIEAGRPIFGIDFDDTVLPAESGLLDRAVSFTKGCYPGQEIVARMHARGQVAKRVAGLRVQAAALPIAGTTIMDESGAAIGAVTSSTLSPVLSNAPICLAMLKRPHFETGTVLRVPAEGAFHEARVVDLPFWRAG